MVAYSNDDMRRMIVRALENPAENKQERSRFIKEMFGCNLDGFAGKRIGEELLKLAQQQYAIKSKNQ